MAKPPPPPPTHPLCVSHLCGKTYSPFPDEHNISKFSTSQQCTAGTEIKVPSVENLELKT